MKDKIKYLIILALACLGFMIIDDVYAISNTSRQSLHLVGTTSYTVYHDGTAIKGPSSFDLQSLAGTSFSVGSFTDSSYGTVTSTFLQWTVPVEVVKGYDKVSFTVGSKWAYFNNATFTTGKGWLACTSLSLPPTTTSFEGGFTSFVCDIDQSSVPESGEVTLYLSTYLTKLRYVDQSGGVPTNPITYAFYYQNDVVFYSSEATSIENQIVESNKELNESIKDTNDTLKDPSVDTDNAGGFFNGFDTEDNGGLSAIITAPLKMVRKATSSCDPLTLQAFDKDIELPCGDTLFWGKPEVAQFRTIWNTIFGGAILFMLLRHVFKTIENVKDPQSDKVEVMKL